MRVFSEFNKYLIQDAGIGSGMDDVQKHFGTLFQLLSNQMYNEATLEVDNLYKNLFLMLEKISIEHITFACFVHSIDDKVLEDYSETNLRLTCIALSKIGVTQGHVEEILEGLKKKLMPS